MVAWIALRISGVQEIDSTHCWISRALEESTLLWSWLTISNQDFIGFSAERERKTLSVTSLFVSIFFIFLFARHLYLFCKNSLVKKSSREFSFPLINSISKSKILKIACHLAKIYLDAIFWTSFCKISLADLQSIWSKDFNLVNQTEILWCKEQWKKFLF